MDKTGRELRGLEGSNVSVALRGGERIDDCQLVSAGRNHPPTLWLFANGADSFVALDEVIDVWEVGARSARRDGHCISSAN
jgi:hypothetical protein